MAAANHLRDLTLCVGPLEVDGPEDAPLIPDEGMDIPIHQHSGTKFTSKNKKLTIGRTMNT
jgi:hypothetical protein